MQFKHIASVLLAVGVLLPIAGASTAPAPIPVGADSGSAVEGSGGTSAPESATPTGAANYTRLYVGDGYRHLELKPGESDSMTVTVENGEDHPVEVSPRLVVPELGERPLDGSWVSIDAPKTTIKPDAEVTVTVAVSVPEDAELGRYRAWIAFTNETVAYPGRPPRPVHAATVSVEVWREPTVRVVAGRHMYTQLQADESYTHQVVIENLGDEAVPLGPELGDERGRRCVGNCPSVLDRSWLTFGAPSEIGPGETATVNITITPPADVERGRYDAEVDLGLKDPARDERDRYWQRIDLNVQVWKQPTAPFEAPFHVSEAATDVTLKLSANGARYPGTSDRNEPARFEVTFVSPTGETVEAERVRIADRGYVDLSGDDRRSVSDGEYAVRGEEKTFVYRVDDPAAGEWTARITPENTVRFRYEIVRNESG